MCCVWWLCESECVLCVREWVCVVYGGYVRVSVCCVWEWVCVVCVRVIKCVVCDGYVRVSVFCVCERESVSVCVCVFERERVWVSVYSQLIPNLFNLITDSKTIFVSKGEKSIAFHIVDSIKGIFIKVSLIIPPLTFWGRIVLKRTSFIWAFEEKCPP